MPSKNLHRRLINEEVLTPVRRLPPSPEASTTSLNTSEEKLEPRLTTISDINPTSKKDDDTTWYTEKNRMSITHIQIPRDDTTEYFYRDDAINTKIMWGILISLVLFLCGAFF